MRNNQDIKISLLLFITIILIISTVSSMVASDNLKVIEEDEHLQKLAFICSDRYSSSKFAYCTDLIQQKKYSNSDDEFQDVIFLVESMASGPMDSAWPMKCHDNRHTGRSPYSTADNPYDEIWRFKAGNLIEDSAVIDSNGSIYFGSYDYYLYSLYPNGTLKWRYKTDDWIWSAPAIDENGIIYAGSYDARLYAIRPDGTKKWHFGTGGTVSSSPAISEDGTIYIGCLGPGNNGRVWAINPNGTSKWYYDTGYWITSDPAIGDDGTVFIGSGDTYFYAINPDGTLKWRYKTGDYVKAPPSIADNGIVYIGSFDGWLYALYSNNGTLKWKYKIGSGTETNPSIGSDGTIYVGGDMLYAINPDGTKKWHFNLGSERYISKSSPAICADDIIYVGTHIGTGSGGEIVAINPVGTERWRKKIANTWVDSSPCIGENGIVYIGSAYDIGMMIGYLYAFGIGELEVDANGPYYGLIEEPLQFTGTAIGGYRPYTYYWDFGDTYNSDKQNPTHTYTDAGTYDVVLTVTDNESNTANDTTFAWIQDGNEPPEKPSIDGLLNGKIETKYDYTFLSSDPEGLHIWYFIEWGDGKDTGWIGPYESGNEIIKTHQWLEKGTFIIKCKTKDPYGAESEWGELKIEIPRTRTTSYHWLFERFPLLERLLSLLL